MGCVRRYLYVPDGKAPAGWSVGRDGQIAAKMLASGDSATTICDAIEGLAMLRDAGEIDWTPPVRRGDKMTLRALYRTASGHLPMWTRALTKLAESQKQGRKAKGKGTPQGIGDILGRIA